MDQIMVRLFYVQMQVVHGDVTSFLYTNLVERKQETMMMKGHLQKGRERIPALRNSRNAPLFAIPCRIPSLVRLSARHSNHCAGTGVSNVSENCHIAPPVDGQGLGALPKENHTFELRQHARLILHMLGHQLISGPLFLELVAQ